MTEHLDLLVLCELNPDVLVTDRALAPRFGQVEQLVEHASLTLGSSGAITAAAASAQGLRVAVCAVVGADLAGEIALRRLADLGVDTSGVLVRPGAATGLTVVLARPDGDRALLTFPGTMGDLTAADVPVALLRTARHVHVSSFYLQAGLQVDLPGLLQGARAAGATTSLDPGWDPAERWEPLLAALPHVDVLLPNAQECAAIVAAADAGDVADVAAAALALAANGPRVVVKLGADGALAAGGGAAGVRRCPAEPCEVVDTTGAGDAFDAGFLAATLAGDDEATALARGVASATVSLGGRGGTGRLASAREAADGAERVRALAARGAPSSRPPRPPRPGPVPLEEPA